MTKKDQKSEKLFCGTTIQSFKGWIYVSLAAQWDFHASLTLLSSPYKENLALFSKLTRAPLTRKI